MTSAVYAFNRNEKAGQAQRRRQDELPIAIEVHGETDQPENQEWGGDGPEQHLDETAHDLALLQTAKDPARVVLDRVVYPPGAADQRHHDRRRTPDQSLSVHTHLPVGRNLTFATRRVHAPYLYAPRIASVCLSAGEHSGRGTALT
jgi:hypothetical protein